MIRQVPDSAIELIAHFEGFRSRPYYCPAGIATIGYGSTRYKDGTPVTINDYAISKSKAMDMLLHDVNRFGSSVLKLISVPLTDNQYGALVSFVYNLGSARLQASTLRKKLNRRDYEGAAREFGKWVFAGKKKLAGLVTRREAERRLFERDV